MCDLGFDPKTGGKALGVLFGMGLISQFLFGFLADRFSPRIVFVVNIVIMFAGMLLIASYNREWIWAGCVITGFGRGGLYTMIQLQAVNNFGLTHAGKIMGTITLMDAIAGGLSIWLTGVMFDVFGSYRIALDRWNGRRFR